MKILRISYEWPPPWAGVPPHIYEVTSHQAKKGHIIHVFCGRWFRAGPVERLPNTTIHTFFREPVPATQVLVIGPLVLFYYLMWRFNNKPDVIHMHGQFGYWVLVYRKFIKKFFKNSVENSIPIVTHFHNNAQDRWDNMIKNGKALKWYTEKISFPLEVRANKLAVEISDACIYVGQAVLDSSIKHYHADPAKSFLVESGVNTDMFVPVDSNERDKTRKELGLIFTDKVILNAGFINERKNIHLLVEALTLLPQTYKLILMGDGEESYIDKIDKYIEEHHLRSRVIRIGLSPYREVPFAMQISDIFVLPSSWEGTSKAILESLSCGVPVLYSGSKLTDNIDGLSYLTEITPETIASEIKRIVEGDSFVDINKIKSLFSWYKKVDEIERVYEYVINNRKKTS